MALQLENCQYLLPIPFPIGTKGHGTSCGRFSLTLPPVPLQLPCLTSSVGALLSPSLVLPEGIVYVMSSQTHGPCGCSENAFNQPGFFLNKDGWPDALFSLMSSNVDHAFERSLLTRARTARNLTYLCGPLEIRTTGYHAVRVSTYFALGKFRR